MTDKTHKHFSCSELSLNAGETIFATAPRVDVWFLLEYRGHWSDNTIVTSRIPENVKKRLNEYLENVNNPRLQLIKRQNNPEERLKFYVALSDELNPRLYEVDLGKYEDLLELDLSRILGNAVYLRKEPVFLICTNGEYDKCCGKYGVPVYLDAVKNENGFTTWQSTHLGGHRFAANVLFLPDGIYYGRVRDIHVSKMIMHAINYNIDLEHYRGRSCYSKDVQAAEYFLRNLTGETEISAFQFKQAKNMGKEKLIFEFISKSDSKNHLVHIQKDKSAMFNYTSCGDNEKSPIAQYRLIDHT
jgi:hypothetical protein